MSLTIRRNGNVEIAGTVIGTVSKNEHGAWSAEDTAGNVVSTRNRNRSTAVNFLLHAVKAQAPAAEPEAPAAPRNLASAKVSAVTVPHPVTGYDYRVTLIRQRDGVIRVQADAGSLGTIELFGRKWLAARYEWQIGETCKTRRAAIQALIVEHEKEINFAAQVEAEKAARKAARAENLAAITEEFRTVEVMTAEGTVYATAGEARTDTDGAITQDVTVTGGKVIGWIRRYSRNEFQAIDQDGNISETVTDQRAAVAILVLDAYAPKAEPAEPFGVYPAPIGPKPAAVAAAPFAAAAEEAETVDAARALLAATDKRTGHRYAGSAAQYATTAAGYARMAVAEAQDAAREAGRLALLIRPDADPAEALDAADAAANAAACAADSARLARGAAECAANYARLAVQYAPEAPQAPETATATPGAPQAATEAPMAAQGRMSPAEAINRGAAAWPRFLTGQTVNIIRCAGQPDEHRVPATVVKETAMREAVILVRAENGIRQFTHWTNVEPRA